MISDPFFFYIFIVFGYILLKLARMAPKMAPALDQCIFKDFPNIKFSILYNLLSSIIYTYISIYLYK